MKYKSPSRRDFVKTGLIAAGAVGLSGLPKSLRSSSEPAAPHYLINVVRKGGWDSLWFHNGVPQSEITDLIDNQRPIVNNQAFIEPTGNIMGPFAAVASNNPPRTHWTVRYPDSYLKLHPDGKTTLGPGLSFVQASDFQNILIWRGLAASGGHTLGNHLLQCGGLSPSYPSFSTSVAAKAIQDGAARRLNYVQIANNSTELCTSTGSYSSTVQPINIPSVASWQALTSPAAKQLKTTGHQKMLDDTVDALAQTGITNPDFMGSTQSAYSAFIDGYHGATDVLTSNYGTSKAFTDTVAAYKDFITSTWNAHAFKTTWFSTAGADDLGTNGYIDTLSFRFALAQFLVTNDLATSIDVLVPGAGDFHNNSMNDTQYHLCLYAAYVFLIRQLSSTECALTPSSSLLDNTTVVMHSEFERHPLISALDQAHDDTPGADHGDFAASVWMAGKNINVGKVIGDFKRGTVSGARYATDEFKSFAGYHPLPLDPTTGEVTASADGIVPPIEALCLTMIDCFGASTTLNTNVKSFAPVLKKKTI